jgi:hypothetical protein
MDELFKIIFLLLMCSAYAVLIWAGTLANR